MFEICFFLGIPIVKIWPYQKKRRMNSKNCDFKSCISARSPWLWFLWITFVLVTTNFHCLKFPLFHCDGKLALYWILSLYGQTFHFQCITITLKRNKYFHIKSSTIVLFKSLRNCKRRNNRNFMLKSNSNKIMLWGSWGQHYLVLNKISK
jgi:hypothetical protein